MFGREKNHGKDREKPATPAPEGAEGRAETTPAEGEPSIEDPIADGSPDAGLPTRPPEDAERKVLERKVAPGPSGRGDPGPDPGVVSLVEIEGHRDAIVASSSSGSRNEQEPKPWKKFFRNPTRNCRSKRSPRH